MRKFLCQLKLGSLLYARDYEIMPNFAHGPHPHCRPCIGVREQRLHLHATLGRESINGNSDSNDTSTSGNPRHNDPAYFASRPRTSPG